MRARQVLFDKKTHLVAVEFFFKNVLFDSISSYDAILRTFQMTLVHWDLTTYKPEYGRIQLMFKSPDYIFYLL